MRAHPLSAAGSVAVGLLVAVGLAVPPSALDAQEKPTLTAADYGKWETLGSFDLDPTGRWLATDIRRTDESVEVRLHRADGTGDPLVLAHASGPGFSRDGRWLAYLKGVSPEEAEASKEPVRNRLGLVDLDARRDTVMFQARAFAFRDDGRWLAVHAYAPSDTVGADLLVLDPATGAVTLLGNVETFAWQDEGPLLALTLRTAAGSGSGVAVFDPGTGVLRTLDARDAHYRALTWRDESAQLAVLRSVKEERRDEESHDVLVWDDVTTTRGARVLPGSGRPELGDTLRVTEYAGVTFDREGRTVFVGVRPWAPPAPPKPDSGDAAAGDTGDDAPNSTSNSDRSDVQVWHWNDDVILRGQEAAASRDERRTLLTAWHADDHLVVLGDELQEPVTLVEGGAWGLVPDYTPYHVARRFGDGAADWYRVDPSTGARTLLAQAVQDGVQTGPDGRVALVYDGDRWVAVTLATLDRKVVGEGSDAAFTRSLEEYDYPGPRPPWGVGAWMEGEEAALLYDRHDVWRADLRSGALTRLTRGAEEGRQYRVTDLDPDARPFSREPATLDPSEPVCLSVRDLITKASRYARVRSPGPVETLVFRDAQVTGLRRARDAQRYALRAERWDDSPDVFVGSASLGDLHQVTATNPFQGDYAWGHSELVSYTTDAGHDLQAILVYPADFEPGRKYPLILYQYERLSDGLHRYYAPSERSYYNYQVWSQQGYFVLMPDIVYEPGRPGPSALDAVEHALDAAVATGHVDADHMGLIGHSWGGYQAAYLPTRTHRFAAAVAGAAITDFISFAGTIHWNVGFPEFGHWETGQARMAVPPWQDLQGHLESS
ncbi:MAG TPA: prolyl oligopeptidase family serine peptidase, partial [Longimicrobiales bacterium]|nr:prolyl oligopeptidase family serine peptidase [Longimicrobiales bacterium]